jgi:hypothetical protein
VACGQLQGDGCRGKQVSREHADRSEQVTCGRQRQTASKEMEASGARQCREEGG